VAGITLGIQIHAAAQQQLRDLMGSDPKAAGEIVAVLDEIQGNQGLLECLLETDFEDERFSITPVVQLQRLQWNCWRLTLFKVTDDTREKIPFRILYAFDSLSRIYHVLAIEPRATAYDTGTIARVAAQCESLGIRRLPRS
jgi:hypothetical protein